MVQLTQHQNSIGGILQEGNHLLTEGVLSKIEEEQVSKQTAILNNSWEELRIMAMDRQANLQESLMEQQQKQLDSLSDWLIQMETYINNCQPVSGQRELIDVQVNEHKVN